MSETPGSREGRDLSRPPEGQSGRAAWMLLSIALLTRIVVFAENSHRVDPRYCVPDSHSYILTAESFSGQEEPPDDARKPAWGRVPGYPALLALLFLARIASPQHLHGAVLVQCLVGALVVVAAARLSRALPGHRGGLAVGLLLALEPSAIGYSNLVLSEILYALALLLGFLAWKRHLLRQDNNSLLWLAAALGCLPLIRPIGLYFPLAVVPLMVWTRWRRSGALRGTVLFLLVAMLPAAAWSWRNFVAMGSFALHSTGPWAQAIFARDVEVRVGSSAYSPAGDFKKPWEPFFGQDQALTSAETMKIQGDYFRRVVSAHPLAAARQFVTNGVLLMGVPDSSLARVLLENPPTVPGGSVRKRILWVGDLGSLGLLITLGMATSLGGLAAIPWLLANWRRWDATTQRLLAFAVVTVVYHMVFSSFVGGQGERYRVPIIPFLALLFTSGLDLLVRGRKSEVGAQSTNQQSPTPRG